MTERRRRSIEDIRRCYTRVSRGNHLKLTRQLRKKSYTVIVQRDMAWRRILSLSQALMYAYSLGSKRMYVDAGLYCHDEGVVVL